MNYELWVEGNGGDIRDTVIGVIFRDPWQRPAVGQEIQIKGKIFTILRCDPADNPENTLVKYYIEKPNDNWPYKRNS